MKKCVLALVGHPNVGKSTLFNRIVGERISIVEDKPGVTRDRLYGNGEWLNQEFTVIDTGGIDIINEPLLKQVRYQAEIAIDEADVILFVVSGREGVTLADEVISKILFRAKKPIVLAVNKVDNFEMRDQIYDFYALGFGEPYAVSGTHGLGLGDILDEVIDNFPRRQEGDIEDETTKFSLIGRPNVGKSSLVNAILGSERVIVSDISGTTRDAVDTPYKCNGNKYVIVDTAGIRKKGKVYENTEKYSVLRALSAIERSNVVLVVLDGSEGIKEQDKKIAGYAHEAGRALVIVVNKWDDVLKDGKTMDNFKEKVRAEMPFLSYAPIVFLSALTKKRIHTLTPLIDIVAENHKKRIQTNLLNDVINDALAINPAPTHKGDRLRLYYSTQVAIEPPSFAIFVNNPDLLHFSYERFLENRLRESFGFEGTPIKIFVRKRK